MTGSSRDAPPGTGGRAAGDGVPQAARLGGASSSRRPASSAAVLAGPVWDAEPGPGRTWCVSEVDILQDLDAAEKAAIADAALVKTYAPGDLLYTPQEPCEALFILKRGRVRVFRISGDGRALTCGILYPGTIFGEMLLLGHRMYGNFAEALDDVTVCVMNPADVDRFLLSDARIATRIVEILGRRLADLEQRLSDCVFKSVSQRVATTLLMLVAGPPTGQSPPPGTPYPEIALTHGQLAALVGTARESVTKVLSRFAESGLVRLSRGRITVLDLDRIRDAAG
ncbi:MAG: Crp/Fnr family transcriptional regulator [Streptomyces sp.]|nr:Crp/Fnr family transcriptional regulator [Streptomyces sp.]